MDTKRKRCYVLRCLECGHIENFSVDAKEFVIWEIDEYGNYVCTLDTGDCERGDYYRCFECGSEGEDLLETIKDPRASWRTLNEEVLI